MTYIAASLIHALHVSDRRCLDRKEAASYVGVSPGTFDKLVRSGEIPPPIRLLGRKVWDRSELDRTIDALSGHMSATAGTNEIDRILGLA